METIKEKNYRLFPGELLWVTGTLYFGWFILYLYNPFQLINGTLLFLLSIYSFGLSLFLFIEIHNKTYRILNIIFSWVINTLDAILNYVILKDTNIHNVDGFIILRNIDMKNLVWYILAIMLFKIVISSIVIVCIERGMDSPRVSLQGMTFFELQNIPYRAIKNNSAYRAVKSLFSKDTETLMIDFKFVQAYYKVFYKALGMVVLLLAYVFLHNLVAYFIKPIRSLHVSVYVLYGLIIGSIIMPVFNYIYYKKDAN
ncbi:hypothetical protein [Gracilinema caldarium]|uniref:Uncharacterized protein n=1 Tax=Gracilinema caldarium (strain ATCC 51460 / DSM 7334 / H1) TaxID=744872 RepID=F8EZS2_GRAC1|nr:hypothetical protein [Gracilinema caldarium]AEJ18435.1 hypothetical protein Spica_0268 [Gracilinema caldarium DSM 7334]